MWVRLVFQTGESIEPCPDVSEFRNEVARRIGSDPFADDAAHEVRVDIDKDESGFRATIALAREGTPIGTRTLHSQSCATVMRAAGLAVVLMLPTHDTAAQAAIEPTTSPPPTPAIASGPQSADLQVSTQSNDRAAKPTTTEVVARFGGAVGLLPSMSESVGLGTKVRWQKWSLDAEAAWHRSSPAPLASGEVVASMWNASAGPCRHFGNVGACGIASVGVMLSEGRKLGTEMQATTPYAALAARATWDYSLGERVALRSSIDLSGTLIRTRLRVTGTPMGTWDAPTTAAAIGMSISGRLW